MFIILLQIFNSFMKFIYRFKIMIDGSKSDISNLIDIF